MRKATFEKCLQILNELESEKGDWQEQRENRKYLTRSLLREFSKGVTPEYELLIDEIIDKREYGILLDLISRKAIPSNFDLKKLRVFSSEAEVVYHLINAIKGNLTDSENFANIYDVFDLEKVFSDHTNYWYIERLWKEWPNKEQTISEFIIKNKSITFKTEDSYKDFFSFFSEQQMNKFVNLAISSKAKSWMTVFYSFRDINKEQLETIGKNIDVNIMYNNFINKYKQDITNLQNIDTIAKFYINNLDKINFDDKYDIYDYLTDYKESETTFTKIQLELELSRAIMISQKQQSIKVGSNRNFVYVYENNYKTERNAKLWINTEISNIPFISKQLTEYIVNQYNTRHKTTTTFKVDCRANRNDILTIYDSYETIEDTIKFLTEFKKDFPDKFKSFAKENPLIAKINGFISYADISADSSYPDIIAEILFGVNNHKNEILQMEDDNGKILKTKEIIIDLMIQDLDQGKLSLINPDNMSSNRYKNIVPFYKIRRLAKNEIKQELLQQKQSLIDKSKNIEKIEVKKETELTQ